MSDKMTKREMFLAVLVVLAAAEADPALSDGILHEVNLLDRKRGTKSVNTAKVKEQAELKAALAAALADGEARATDLATAVDVTVQKASAILRLMVADGTVVRRTEKKITFFSLAEAGE